MFFNQTQFDFKLTVHETSDTPILSAVLYIDKNIANKTEFGLDMWGLFFLSENFYYWSGLSFHARLRVQAGKFNGSGSLIFNVSSDIPECSAGMRTFVMVPVKFYALSLVGSFIYSCSSSNHKETIWKFLFS